MTKLLMWMLKSMRRSRDVDESSRQNLEMVYKWASLCHIQQEGLRASQTVQANLGTS
jgi:hypothetical protein